MFKKILSSLIIALLLSSQINAGKFHSTINKKEVIVTVVGNKASLLIDGKSLEEEVEIHTELESTGNLILRLIKDKKAIHTLYYFKSEFLSSGQKGTLFRERLTKDGTKYYVNTYLRKD